MLTRDIMTNVNGKYYGTLERGESQAAPSARSRGRVTQLTLGVLAVVGLGAYAMISRKGGLTAQPLVADFHKATKCTDQCSSYDWKGVAECEKHYQIESLYGCDALKCGCDEADCYQAECHGCKYDEFWKTCSEKSSCDDGDDIKEASNYVCYCALDTSNGCNPYDLDDRYD